MRPGATSVLVWLFLSWWVAFVATNEPSSDENVHGAWNRLVKYLLGNESGGSNPWRDLYFEPAPHVYGAKGRKLSVASLKGLDDNDMWLKLIGSDDRFTGESGDEGMINDESDSFSILSDDAYLDVNGELSNDSETEEHQSLTLHKNTSHPKSEGNVVSEFLVENATALGRKLEDRRMGENMLETLLYQNDGVPLSSTGVGPKDAVGSATLAFVFDTTGSMWDDLRQVRQGAEKIMDTMLQRPDKPIYDYVLVPFHDPLVGPVTVTTDHKLMMQRLNEINIYGGGDCPEASVEAVLQALQLSRPNSYIYVFTDARSKDYHLISQVLPLIQRKQSQVVFVMTGDCGDQNHPGYQVYHKIAATSSGQVYHLNKSDVDEVLSFVRVSLQSRKVNLLSVDRPPAHNDSALPLPIDQTLKEFTVSVSGSNASIGVVDPGGQAVHPPQLTPLLDLQNVKVVNVKEPPPGMWTLQVGSDSQHTVRSTGLSGSDFVYGFSVIPTNNMAETYHRPLKAAVNSVLVRATEPANLYNFTKLELVHLNGSVLDVIALCAVPGQPGLYSGGPFVPPNEFFYISVSGYGLDNYPIRRITATAVSAQTPELPTVSMAPTFTAQIGGPLTLTCKVESLVPFVVRWFKDGVVKTKLLKFNQTAQVPLKIEALKKGDAGLYICKAQIPNIPGSVSKMTRVHVTGPPPKIVTQEEVIAKAGTKAVLDCIVTSEMPFNVTWFRLVTTTSHGGALSQPSLEPVNQPSRVVTHANNSLVISSLDMRDEGWYICTANNKGGQTSGRVYLSLQQPPAVRVSPSHHEFTVGSHLNIYCQVLAGIPYPTITWIKGTTVIQSVEKNSDGTLWTLNLRSLQKEDEGEYSCKASNFAGTTNEVAELVLLERPQVKVETESLLIHQGESAILRCIVTGSPPPKLNWYKDSQLLSSDHPHFKNINDGVLEILRTNPGDSGQYTCVAQNKAGTDKAHVQLQVGYPPRVVHLPTDLLIPIGGSGSMLCAAIGVPVPRTTWTKNGAPIIKSSVFVSELGELFIRDAQLEDEDNYTCTVENTFGKAEYQVAVKITGIVAPQLMVESLPETMKALVGRNVQLPCPVLEGHPPPSRIWYKNDVPLDSSQYPITSDGSLLLANLSAAEAGVYKCVVSNVGGQDTLVTTLDIMEPPSILLTEDDGEMRAVEGSSISLHCPVSGNPPPSITWLRHGKHLSLSESDGSSPLLTNVSFHDAGSYTCLALSPAGSDSKSITLNILVPPKITKWEENLTISEGHYAHLECQVLANPPANISWYYMQLQLPYHSPVVRFSVNKSMEGEYKCVAENEVGSFSQTVNIFVSVAPRIDPLTPTKAVGIAGEEVSLHCPATGDPKPVVTWSKFGVELLRQTNEDGSIPLTNLTPSDAGMYLCSATNIAGSSVLPVSLEVLVKPVIVDWEAELNVVEGELLTLRCAAESQPPATIHWIRHGVPLSAQGPTVKFFIKREDAGNYTCVAENQVGSNEQIVNVNVLVPAYIPDSKEEIVNMFGNSSETRLECLADGLPKPSISWFKDSVNVTGNIDPRLRVEQNKLTIINATQELAAPYLCHAENTAGIAQKIFRAKFYESPKILDLNPTNITLREGDDFTIPCTADGIPTPTVHWMLGEKILPPGFQNDELLVMQDNMLVFTQVTSSSGSLYSCVAVNLAGTATRNYSLQVIEPPVVVDKSVTHVEIEEASTGLLTCPIHPGSPQPTVQWLKDGVPISLVTNERADDAHYNLKDGGRTLKIVEAYSEDSGLYTCIAANIAGRSQASFSVDVLIYPFFTDQFPEKEYVKSEGEKLVLDCSVSGNPQPKVSWKRVELGLPVTQHTTPGVMLELPSRWKLIIPALQYHHSGTYQCSAANKLGRNTRTFSVRVIAPPELDGPKEETLEVLFNESVVLQCRVWGTPPPDISWDYSNTSIGFQRIENVGDDARLLELSRVVPSQAGIYRCTANNTLGEVSKLFNVSVSEPPRVESSDITEELMVRLGGDLVLTCVLTGKPTPVVSWLHNGHVVSNQTYSVQGQTHTLRMSPVTLGSAGKYSCVSSNKAGVTEKTFKVKVLVPPTLSESHQFTSGDPRVVVLEGLPLTIRCPVTATPPLHFTWQKDGKHINQTDELMSVKSASMKDRGNYTCTATNHVGNISKTFLVDVNMAPVIKGKDIIETLEVKSKSKLQLNCSVSGHPQPSILWLKGSTPLGSGESLAIESVGLEHSGRYTCLASNIAGSAEKTFFIMVLEPPSVMGDEAMEDKPPVELKAKLHRKAMIECPVNGAPQPIITWYKDGELLTGQQVSSDGRNLHIMNALPKHGGNYSCVAENQAGTTRLYFPLTVIVPLQWSEWTNWTECSKICGGGKEERQRQCISHNGYTESEFVKLDSSECMGDQDQSRACNVLPCQVHGGWGEWTNWTSCSESCGKGTRRRYRNCDSPAPAFGGLPCLGSDGQQESCIIQPCPVSSHWGEWTEWSRCTRSCGLGTKFRARLCVRGSEVVNDCEGPNKEVSPCSNRKCPVNGKWLAWGPWSDCSVSCGRGLRQRHRLCTKHLYGGKPCPGDNIEIEKCDNPDCNIIGPKSAALRIRGKLNGERVEDMYLDAEIQQDGPKRLVTATLNDILKSQANWFPYLTFLMPPFSLNSPSENIQTRSGDTLESRKYTEESRFQFATGQELVVKHTGKGTDDNGAYKVDIEVMGEVPVARPTSSIIINPYKEDFIQTGPNSLYTSSKSSLDINGERLPFEWNRTVIFDDSRGTMPYLVERLSTDEIETDYNPWDQKLNFKISSEISRTYDHNKCPFGFKLDSKYHHCSDIDECTEWKRACRQNQICENQFGSYRCSCQHGYRMSINGEKCVDINECLESDPCSHSCHNTKGSYHCSCPSQLTLGNDGHTCKAWGDVTFVGSEEDYGEEDDAQYLEARRLESVACRPGLEWQDGSCTDIDECLYENTCEEETFCMNTKGSYYCLDTPCLTSQWDPSSRSCVKVCQDWPDGCSENIKVAEFMRPLSLSLSHSELQPYEDLLRLQPRGLQNETLRRTVYNIIQNDRGVPLRIRIENGEAILYVMKYFQVDGLCRISILATSFSKDYKTKEYKTEFRVFLIAEP